MTTIETTQAIPLSVWDDGSIRLIGSRLTLDAIVHEYQSGSSAEQIADSFPPTSLADIYAVIAYYLAHRAQVAEYLRRREAEAVAAQQSLEAAPGYQESRAAMRERLLARWASEAA